MKKVVMTPKKVGIAVFTAIALILVLSLANQVVETNDLGYYQIKQAAISGELSVKNDEGMYFQGFGNIHTYKISDTYFFDGTEGSTPITVRFQDGGTAAVHGSLKYRLSGIVDNQIALHRDFRGQQAVRLNLVAPIVKEALKQSSPFMDAEDSYSTKRSEFTSLIEDQITQGIFETVTREEKRQDKEGNYFIKKWNEVKLGEDNKPLFRKPSPFLDYKITVVRFVITNIDYDETIDALIHEKKKAQQKMVVAKAKAEESKQDAITARESGKARIAKAKADQEVEKITEVTKAEKAKAVAQLNAERDFNVAKLNAEKKLTVAELNKKAADETAKAKLVLGESEAKVAKLKVAAGLTPLKEAEIMKETQIGVARELSKLKLPETFISGGSGSNGGVDPFTAIGLESLLKIKDRMSTKK